MPGAAGLPPCAMVRGRRRRTVRRRKADGRPALGRVPAGRGVGVPGRARSARSVTAVRSRALLWLPPVLVALGVGYVLSRAATGRGDREPLEQSIRAHWEVPDDAAQVEEDVARYVAA